MTLDEAIKHAEEVADTKLQDAELSEIQGCYNNAKKCSVCADEHRQLAKWLKELKQLKEQQPCEDCISRQAAIDAVETIGFDFSNSDLSEVELEEVCEAIGEVRQTWLQRIKRLPSVEPEKKLGHWEWDQGTGEYVCSECGCNPIYERTTPDVSEIDKYRYCRWCGAPMEVNADAANN